LKQLLDNEKKFLEQRKEKLEVLYGAKFLTYPVLKKELMQSSRMYKLILTIHSIAETVPNGYDAYTPTAFEKLLLQIKGQMGHLSKWREGNTDNISNDQEVFSRNERVTINNHAKKIGELLTGKDKESFEKSISENNYFKKVEFIYKKSCEPSIHCHLRKDMVEIIEGNYRKLDKNQGSLNENEEGEEEKRYASTLESLILKEDIIRLFEHEFNADDEKDFIEYIKEESIHILDDEIYRYTSSGHNTDSILYKQYLQTRSGDAIVHTVFARKIRNIIANIKS
jgi:hypothetical protein